MNNAQVVMEFLKTSGLIDSDAVARHTARLRRTHPLLFTGSYADLLRGVEEYGIESLSLHRDAVTEVCVVTYRA